MFIIDKRHSRVCEKLWYLGEISVLLFSLSLLFMIVVCVFCFVSRFLVCQGNLRGFTYRSMNFQPWSCRTHFQQNNKNCMIIQWRFDLMLSPSIPLDYVSFFPIFCIVRNSNLEFIKTKIFYLLLCVHFSQPEKKYYVNKETKIFVGKKPIEWNNNNNGMIHI